MAIKTQGTTVSVETALAITKPITGATATKPVVITSAAHGYANGDIVKIVNIVGMVQLNERAFVVASSLSGSFELKGEDGTSFDAYISGGDSFKATLAPVGTVDGLPTLFAGQAQTIKVTHLKSVREETQQGLAAAATVSMGMLLGDGDVGQTAMQTANLAQTERVYTIQRPDGKTACFVAFCDSFQIAAAQNDVYRVTSSLTLRAAQTSFA